MTILLVVILGISTIVFGLLYLCSRTKLNGLKIRLHVLDNSDKKLHGELIYMKNKLANVRWEYGRANKHLREVCNEWEAKYIELRNRMDL